MPFQDLPIKRKLRTVILLTSFVVLILTTAVFVIFDTVTYRRLLLRDLSTTASLLTEHGAPAVVAGDSKEAQVLLAALRADPGVVAAAFYDSRSRLLAHYPAAEPERAFPPHPPLGYKFRGGYLELAQPVIAQRANVGTLYLRLEVRPLYVRFRLLLTMIGLVFIGSALVAIGLSEALQRRISRPILALARTAQAVSERGDFSVRSPRLSGDELGTLTDAFNQMLARIQHDEGERKRFEQETLEREARFSAIISSAMDAIISVNSAQTVTMFNSAAERMFRCSAREALGQPLDKFIPERFRQTHRREVEAFGQTGTTSRAMGHLRPLSALRADGEEFPIEASISQVEIGGEKIFTVILRDITQRQRIQEEIRSLNTELDHRVELRTTELTAANRELEAFTYSVAHDLRAPLRHIEAFSRMLREEYANALPAAAQQFLASITAGARHMSQLVDDLLNLARVGRQELKREPTELSRVVGEVVSDLKKEAGARNIDWRLHPLPTLACDAGLMKQVFANLLSNALKYTRPRDRAVIEVGALPGNTAVYVRDNGVGFNMKYAGKLFGVFRRLHRAEQFEGTGVGLATVERIVRKHGGCVWAEAVEDKGAAFYFSLPGMNGSPDSGEDAHSSE